MAQYRVLTKSFINNSIYEEGAIVEYDGQVGSNLELVEEVADEPKAKAKKSGKAPDVVSEGE